MPARAHAAFRRGFAHYPYAPPELSTFGSANCENVRGSVKEPPRHHETKAILTTDFTDNTDNTIRRELREERPESGSGRVDSSWLHFDPWNR